MKIINQSADEMILSDGNKSSVLFGAVFCIVGLYILYKIFALSSFNLTTVAIGLIFAVVGLLMALSATKIIVDINKGTGSIFFQKKSLIKNKTAEYQISNVVRIELREARSNNNYGNRNMGTGISFGTPRQTVSVLQQAVIVMNDGAEVPLENIKDSSSGMNIGGVLMAGRSNNMSISNQVAQFIGVPFQDIGGSGTPNIPIMGINN